MAAFAVAAPVPRNHLLAALTPEVLAALWPRFEHVELSLRQILQAPGEPIGTVYFPETGWISMLACLTDHDAAEVGLIGPEGMVGLPVLLGSDSSDLQGMVQGPGTALRMDTAAFREALESFPTFRTLLLRYALLHHEQVARTAACNGRHRGDQRLARWLLMAHDRAEGDQFPMTHKLLSMMLGLNRPGITVAAGQLQKAGLIRYKPGSVEVIDRPGLESAACACHGIVRRAQDRLFGVAPGKNIDRP